MLNQTQGDGNWHRETTVTGPGRIKAHQESLGEGTKHPPHLLTVLHLLHTTNRNLECVKAEQVCPVISTTQDTRYAQCNVYLRWHFRFEPK